MMLLGHCVSGGGTFDKSILA